MKNSIQISLFFNEETFYKINELSYELSKEIEELEEPLLFPENKTFPQEANAPLIMFVRNKKVQFISNFYNATLKISEENIEDKMEYIKKIMDVLDRFKVSSYRIGYVINLIYDKDQIPIFKKDVLKKEEIINSKDFELSWLTEIDIKDTKVNYWQRFYTNEQMNEKLNVLYDINTKPTEKINIQKDYIIKFVEEVDNRIGNLAEK